MRLLVFSCVCLCVAFADSNAKLSGVEAFHRCKEGVSGFSGFDDFETALEANPNVAVGLNGVVSNLSISFVARVFVVIFNNFSNGIHIISLVGGYVSENNFSESKIKVFL